jgi:hypothetical protein
MDAYEILEVLEIGTEDLLEKFDTKIAENYDKLNEELSDE